MGTNIIIKGESYEKNIEDVSILDVYSETGNTSGTGNHCECLSQITFETGVKKSSLTDLFCYKYKYYELDSDDGSYTVTVIRSAPFIDNIEGH